MYNRIRPFLFKLDPERMHEATLQMLKLTGKFGLTRRILNGYFDVPDIPVDVHGLNFKNPIGLAAGYDKDGVAWRGLACLGFGHIEVGTVTPKPQNGNPKPRIFRLPEREAIINRMGFPGKGADFVLKQLKEEHPPDLVLGVNIGMNKTTLLENAVQDYRILVEKFSPVADYLTVNISSPNTAGLRDLQKRRALTQLLHAVKEMKIIQEKILKKQMPLFVKLSPDLADRDLDNALDVILSEGMDGVIVTNTTIQRDGLSLKWQNEKGGLSGLPLRKMSTDVIKKVYRRTSGRLVIIGVGGIMSADAVKEKLNAGASLVQVYTGLVYKGPSLVKQILTEIKE